MPASSQEASQDTKPRYIPPRQYRVVDVTPELKLHQYYQRTVESGGLLYTSNGNSSDYALAEAAYIADHMLLGLDNVRKHLAEHNHKVGVIPYNEPGFSLPELLHMKEQKDKGLVQRLGRGNGATVASWTTSIGEENLLNYPGDPRNGGSIFVHEFAHTIHLALRRLNPQFQAKLQAAYDQAMREGLWKGQYASTTIEEYFAVSTTAWFRHWLPNKPSPDEIYTRQQLIQYDPRLAELLYSVYGDNPWSYRPLLMRPNSELTHLVGYNPAKAPLYTPK